MIEIVPERQGDHPLIALESKVIEFINSPKVPTPPALNAYQCERRKGHIIVTIDMHPGVTPAFLSCQYPHCPGQSRSMFYPTGPMPDIMKTLPLYLWYRPSQRELEQSDLATQDHIRMGGLLIRKSDQNIDQFMAEWEKHK